MSTVAANLRFARYELRPHERRLLVDGQPATLGSRAFDVLIALVERAGQLVTKHQLMDLVWPDVVVEENNLQAQISSLRKVLGGDVIATIPGRGYRFTARVAPANDDADSTVPPAGPISGPAEAAAPERKTNLPEVLPPLIGRLDELAAIGALIDQHRFVTLVGVGGMGKTRLAQALLQARRQSYPQGVCWVELEPVTDAAALPGVIGAALGLRLAGGNPLESLIAAIQPFTLLLALDNAEHLLAGVADIAQALHQAAPRLRLIVTSQAPLKLAAEHVYRLGALALPLGPLPASEAQAFDAVALFVERAQAADARFALTDANAPPIIELCRALDGLPLAIELAAARASTLGVQRLAASLDERLRLLTMSRNRAAPTRQQTLRAALEWSHGFLDANARAVFRRLAVTAGSSSLELIQRVASDATLDEWAVLDALVVLVDRSLVAVIFGDDASAPVRYRLLDSPRAYALEQLAQAGELDAVRRRHAEAVTAFFEAIWDSRFETWLSGEVWFRRHEAELDNTRAAHAWACARAEPMLQLALGTVLLPLLVFQLHAERPRLAQACEALLATPDAAQWPVTLRLRAWLEIGVAPIRSAPRQAWAAALQALALARDDPHAAATSGDRAGRYAALALAVYTAQKLGEWGAAGAMLAEMRAVEDPAWALQRRALTLELECTQEARPDGSPAAALVLHRRLVSSLRTAGLPGHRARVNLIDAELHAGDAPAAARTGAALVAELEGSREQLFLGYARVNLVAALLALDDVAQARPVAEAGWAHAVPLDLQPRLADYLALLAALEGRARSAAQLVGYADAAYARGGGQPRKGNEAQACARATALARGALGEAEFERRHADGHTLRDADIAALAFATADIA